jgi:hypothetical protein
MTEAFLTYTVKNKSVKSPNPQPKCSTYPANLGKRRFEVTGVNLMAEPRDVEAVSGIMAAVTTATG